MLESLFAEKSGGKKSLRKEIDSRMLNEIEEFHKISFNWNYLLNFSSTYHVIVSKRIQESFANILMQLNVK